MKRTELERIEREYKRTQKKQDVLDRKAQTKGKTKKIGEYIDELAAMFRHDLEQIYNINDNLDILELLEQMKQDIPEKQWENVLRKAIKKTGIVQKENAYNQLKDLVNL